MTLKLLAGLGAVLALAACAPKAPEGIDKIALDVAVNNAIGDPGTCVLIGEVSGATVYRYGTNMTCARVLNDCLGGQREVAALLQAAVGGAPPVNASCASLADGSRTVAWNAGPVEGKSGLVYAAVMEGEKTPPGIVIADKLKGAFAKAGL